TSRASRWLITTDLVSNPRPRFNTREVSYMHEPRAAEKDAPYWWEAAPLKPLPQQTLPKKLDVLIVGAGYAGLSAGLVLAREGRSVAAFDAMNPGGGASTRNGGITSGSIRP